MKNNCFYILLVFSLIACSANKLAKEGVYSELPAKEYEALIKKGNVNIIDVRTKGEYRKSHIKGAVNASYLSGNFLDLVAQYNLDTNKVTLIYCETQHRSPVAAKRLRKIGFKQIIDLEKGMGVWRKQDFSYESDISKDK